MAVSTGTGRKPINPVPNSSRRIISRPATTDIICVFPSNCSPIAVLDTLPFTGQEPENALARFPAAQARISRLSFSGYPFLKAKVFSASRVSAITTTAIVRLVPRICVISVKKISGIKNLGSPGSTAERSFTP